MAKNAATSTVRIALLDTQVRAARVPAPCKPAAYAVLPLCQTQRELLEVRAMVDTARERSARIETYRLQAEYYTNSGKCY